MKLEFSLRIFEKCSNSKCHENLSSGSRTVQSGQTDRQTVKTKLIVAFRSFTKAPDNVESVSKVVTNNDSIYILMNT
jgi:hypothetical protein